MPPTGLYIVTPMTVAVGEPVAIKVKVLGPVREVRSSGFHLQNIVGLNSPFNVNAPRKMHYLDNVPETWTGRLIVDGGEALEGPDYIDFDGEGQGVFPGDRRPIRQAEGWRWTRPGFHWIRLTDPESGVTALSNPVLVTGAPPASRLYFGDIHWQSFFSDGLRCPEELYAFARTEAFLDFGALTDHAEGLTDRQWEYFCAVTNDSNAPGAFATLVGLEWTHHRCGHRNVYYRGDAGPIIRSNDPGTDTLDGLWAALEGQTAVAIPHHPANAEMGVNWELGWNPAYEKAVEIHSVWGTSEYPGAEGNPMPIRLCGGEKAGQHVVDALRRGYRLGFVGGGDIHDGRPGNELHSHQVNTPQYTTLYRGGYTAARLPALTREHLFDALGAPTTYATTADRIYLDVARGDRLRVTAAAAAPITEAVLLVNGTVAETLSPGDDPRVVQADLPHPDLGPHDFAYVRLRTAAGTAAWSSPWWG
jgi:hypothetical protein